MNLQQTVSKILGKQVSSKRAQLFANEEFGVLCAYIRNTFVEETLKSREQIKQTEEYKDLQKISYFADKKKEKTRKLKIK